MRIAGIYSFNDGTKLVTESHPSLLKEVKSVIKLIDAGLHKTKQSKEKTMIGRMLYSPVSLNKAFKSEFRKFENWTTIRVPCDYPTTHYLEDYKIRTKNRGAFREMDFVKDQLGIEV